MSCHSYYRLNIANIAKGQAQEVDVSDVDFEDEDEEMGEGDEEEKPKANGAQPNLKKRKA